MAENGTRIIHLNNVDVGDDAPAGRFAAQSIGNFQVALVDDYVERAKHLSRNARKTGAQHFPARKGGWTITATATRTSSTPQERSVWLMEGQDDGVWDLCELLTFVSGRRVTIDELIERYSPGPYVEPCCLEMEVLPTAAAAWDHREELVKHDVVYALAFYNEAISIRLLPAAGALYYAALNILTDKLVENYPRIISKNSKKAALAAVDDSLAKLEGVNDEERAIFSAIALGAIRQGPSAMTDRLTQLLVEHGVIPTDRDEAIKNRVRYVMAARNWHAHGRLRPIEGLSVAQANRYALVATTAVVPCIIRLVLGRLLGFSPFGAGSRSQNSIGTLKRFFKDGKWHEWDIGEESFEAYFDRLGESLDP